jgi:hypothetical protein
LTALPVLPVFPGGAAAAEKSGGICSTPAAGRADRDGMNGFNDSIVVRRGRRGRAGFLPRTAWAAVWLACAAPSGPSIAAVPEAPQLPPLVRSKQQAFSIPFQVPPPRERDGDAAVRRVVLQVSRDLGGTWETVGEAAPDAGAIGYRATADGEYWFRLRATDAKGRTRGGPGPDMRVLVDVAGPRLAARVWKGVDGEIVCRYAATDDSIDLGSLKVEYRGPGDPGWKTVAAEGILARQSPAHMVGEEIWWAGEKVESLTVRIAVSDAAGNPTARQFSLEPADPQIDQSALAAEIGVPALPAGPDTLPTEPAAPMLTVPSAPHRPVAGTPAGAWPSEQAAAWSSGQPAGRGASGPATDRTAARSVLVARTVQPGADATGTLVASPAASPATAGTQPLEYRGRPLLLSRSRRFAWNYETPADTAADSGLQAVLWYTADGGATWARAATTEPPQAALEVLLPGPGLYGFRLELVADVAATGPRSGDSPETWVGVDEEPPQVELIGTERVEGDEDALLIRYAANDTLLAPRSARLLFSPHAEGPWATITQHAENQGVFTWRPDRGLPARVHLRVEVTDAAGNVGAATTAEPIAVAPSRFTGRLGDLKPLPRTP